MFFNSTVLATSRPATTTVSLGRASAHGLREKLTAAAAHGFQGIELFYEDLEYLAAALMKPSQQEKGQSEQKGKPSEDALLAAADTVRVWCSALHLTIVNLQPLFFDEGILSRWEHAARLDKLALWCRIAHALGTGSIAIASSMLPSNELSSDLDQIAADLSSAARLAAAQIPPIRLSYEALAWGTRIDTWETSWDVVRRADCANLGLCLDTFNICGRIYGDPAAASGLNEANSPLLESVRASAARLVAAVPAERIFFVQLADAERLDKPLVQGHPLYNAEQPAKMTWSRNCRLFYGESERGAYLPVDVFTKAIFDNVDGLAWNGWVSSEIFHLELFEPRPGLPRRLAQRGAAAWSRLLSSFEVRQQSTRLGRSKDVERPPMARL